MAVDEENPDKNVTKMSYKHTKALVGTAQKLRKQMTDEEKHLWYAFLKKLPITVNRQKNIDNYIVYIVDMRHIGIDEGKWIL